MKASRGPFRFAVIGAGMAGILSAIKLRERGLDCVVYEKADRVGGTWRANTYPGVACDVPSQLYCYSFAQNPDWSHVFSPGGEIFEYLEDVAASFGVLESIRFGTEIERLDFRDGRWHLTTTSGETDTADVVIAATGVLHHPFVPEIDGLGRFTGPVFHSANWDHGVTLDSQRVGIVGTGSSAIQIVGAIVDQVSELRLFQRTAQWVLPMDNPAISDEDKERYRSNPAELAAARDRLGHVFADTFAAAVIDAESPHLKVLQDMCTENLEQHVDDPELRERLRPSYQAGCKRLIVSPNFYDAITRPNAGLVTDPILAVEPDGVRTADGVLHELDILILATGFRVDRFLRPITVIGPDEVHLDDLWADRPSAYLSVSIPGFPNLFLLNGPNGPVGNFSLIDVAELQFAYIMQLVQAIFDEKCSHIAATRAAAEAFEAERTAAARNTVWVTGCRSWYLDDRGIPAAWPWTMDHFRDVMREPDFADFDLRDDTAIPDASEVRR